ncbi:uncharacterized protein [Amphiura filiformis]|uniref:uncharacterized protein n=1 Tax=Amphiura filiformis TaxID=82378 RepID=UPI003B22076C
MYGRVGVVVDMDADVQFFLPNASRNHSNTCTGEHDIIHRILTKSTQSNGELRMDQVICQKEEKLVLCKPWQQLFKDSPPVLPFRRPSGEISTVSVSSGSNIADDATTNSDDSHYRSVTYDSVTDSDSGHDTLDEEPTISTGKIYEGHKNLMDGQVRNINHMNESTLSKNEPGHDRRNTLQKRRNKIITSPYVNIAIVPPERKPTHAPVPSLTLDRTHNRALYDDHPCSSNTTQEQYAPFSTSLPNRSHFLEDEDIMYQNCVPNTTTSIVYQNSVQDGIRPPSHYKPKPHPRKSSFKRTVENGQDPRPQVWQRRETERKEIQTPTRLPSCPITPPAYKEMDLNDNVFVESSFQNTKEQQPVQLYLFQIFVPILHRRLSKMRRSTIYLDTGRISRDLQLMKWLMF